MSLGSIPSAWGKKLSITNGSQTRAPQSEFTSPWAHPVDRARPLVSLLTGCSGSHSRREQTAAFWSLTRDPEVVLPAAPLRPLYSWHHGPCDLPLTSPPSEHAPKPRQELLQSAGNFLTWQAPKFVRYCRCQEGGTLAHAPAESRAAGQKLVLQPLPWEQEPFPRQAAPGLHPPLWPGPGALGARTLSQACPALTNSSVTPSGPH